MKGESHCKRPAIRNEIQLSRPQHNATYRVNPYKDITNEYGEKYPTGPNTCIEAIEEIGSKNGSKHHGLDYNGLSK